MGRYSVPLAPPFAGFRGRRPRRARARRRRRTGRLERPSSRSLVLDAVTVVDPPSSSWTLCASDTRTSRSYGRRPEDCRSRTRTFDAAIAQLVVHFMADPVRGLDEMRRGRPGAATVAASVWDHGGGEGPLSIYWEVVRELDPRTRDESARGRTRGHLAGLFAVAGLTEVEEESLRPRRAPDLRGLVEPNTLGVGPAGRHVTGLDPRGAEGSAAVPRAAPRAAVRDQRERLVGTGARLTQSPSCSTRKRTTGQAPSVEFEITVHVVCVAGSCSERNETLASEPTSLTRSLDSCSQKPRP